jgi:hypothetical protein
VFGSEAVGSIGSVVLGAAGRDDGVSAARQLVAAHKAVSFFVGAEAEGSFGGVAVRLGCTVLALDRGRALAEYIKQRGLAVRGGIDRKTLERWRDALDSPQQGSLPPFISLLRAWLNRQFQARG